MADAEPHYKILTWNVRGMNNVARQEDIKQVVNMFKPDIVCIQETKIALITPAIIRSTLGRDYESSFIFKPAEGTRGGIIIAARDPCIQFQNPIVKNHSISAQIIDCRLVDPWLITGVYGPQGDLEKAMFIRELKGIKQIALEQWLILGDFNLIYKEQDKNNNRLNRRLMSRFRRALNYIEVKEVHLTGRKFTWSNGQRIPTLTRIDRVFYSPAWEEQFGNTLLQSLSSLISDHCPLLLSRLVTPYVPPRFKFEAFWTSMPRFKECVQGAWEKQVPPNKNPLATLHIRLGRTAKALQIWSKSLISQSKVATMVCREVIEQLERIQEIRQWSEGEKNLIQTLKVRLLGLAAIERSRARQKSRLTWLQKGDANTKKIPLNGQC
jgi:exonuclease III